MTIKLLSLTLYREINFKMNEIYYFLEPSMKSPNDLSFTKKLLTPFLI